MRRWHVRSREYRRHDLGPGDRLSDGIDHAAFCVADGGQGDADGHFEFAIDDVIQPSRPALSRAARL